jgi:hypothetical protein
MIDEKKIYQELWDIINAHIYLNKLGRPHSVNSQLPTELIKYCLKIIQENA